MPCDNLQNRKCRVDIREALGGSALWRRKISGCPARVDQLKISLFGMYIDTHHSLGMGDLYQLPLPLPSAHRRRSGKSFQKQQEWVGFRSARGTEQVLHVKGADVQMPRDRQGAGPQTPHGLSSYKIILFWRTKMTFKDLGMEDLGIYSCDVTDTDGIASSYLIDEEGKWKISSFTSLLWFLSDSQGSSDFCFSSSSSNCSLFLPTELKRLLALSQEHKFPSKCPQYIHRV